MKRERIVWISISVVLVVSLLMTTVGPYAFAQNPGYKRSEVDSYMRQIEQVYTFVLQNYVEEVEPEVLYEGAMKGLFNSLDDPHSRFLDAQSLRDLTDTTQGEFGGLGIIVSKPAPGTESQGLRNRKPYVEVVSPIEGTPAYKAGLNAGDYIIKVNGEDVKDLTIDEVVNKLRGAPGTDVTVTILRGAELTFDVTLTRAVIEVPTIKYDMMPGKTAYLRISEFTRYTSDRVQDAIKDFEKQGYEKMIIDVRHNPGGLLSSVVDVCDFFFDNGLIVSIRSRDEADNDIYRASNKQLVPDDVPIVVLIDEGSASASEILAGAFKDRSRGYIMGRTSYGKGSVQEMRLLGNAGFRLTMARYYTPDGINIDKIGIDPDHEVKEPETTEEDMEELKELYQNSYISKYLKGTPDPSKQDIDEFVDELMRKDIDLDERVLKRLVYNEINRTKNDPPVYDLNYDIVLKEAYKYLKEKQ